VTVLSTSHCIIITTGVRRNGPPRGARFDHGAPAVCACGRTRGLAMNKKVAFLDANTFLHFPSIDQIDWTALVGAEVVDLAIAPVIYRQLERHKRSARARTAVSKIRSLAESRSALPPNVELRFLHDDPRIDFEANRLSRDIEDDQLIASMIQYRSEAGSAQLVLITEDFLLKRKAQTSGFEVACPDHSLRLPDEPSEEDREIRKLREENLRLQNQRPKLNLLFVSGANRHEVVLTPLPGWGEEEKQRRMHKLEEAHPIKVPPTSREELEQLWPSTSKSMLQSEYDTHNKALKRFYDEGRVYFDQVEAHEIRAARSFEFTLRLANVGKVSATDIDISIKAQAKILIFEKDNPRLKPPKPPTPPPLPFQRPESELFSVAGLYRSPMIDLASIHSPLEPVSVEVKNLKSAGFEIDVHVRKLKASLTEELGPFVVIFASDDAIRPFKLTYAINCEGMPETEAGELHLLATSRV
jgi:hypothetical protein